MNQSSYDTPRASRRNIEEERAWGQIYRRTRNRVIAVEVVKQLDADPDSKRSHMALYIRCQQTVRQQKVRLARKQRTRAFVRHLLTALLAVPVRTMSSVLRRGRDITIEALPEPHKEPAIARLLRLKQAPGLAPAGPDAGQPGVGTSANASAPEASDPAKAA